jgi:hypothetical protein
MYCLFLIACRYQQARMFQVGGGASLKFMGKSAARHVSLARMLDGNSWSRLSVG